MGTEERAITVFGKGHNCVSPLNTGHSHWEKLCFFSTACSRVSRLLGLATRYCLYNYSVWLLLSTCAFKYSFSVIITANIEHCDTLRQTDVWEGGNPSLPVSRCLALSLAVSHWLPDMLPQRHTARSLSRSHKTYLLSGGCLNTHKQTQISIRTLLGSCVE